MNGQECLVEAVGLVKKLLAEAEAAGAAGGNAAVEKARRALGVLDPLKGRPTLRTRAGTNLALPVLESAKRVEECREDARGGGDLAELDASLEGFATAVDILAGALKERTVIMT